MACYAGSAVDSDVSLCRTNAKSSDRTLEKAVTGPHAWISSWRRGWAGGAGAGAAARSAAAVAFPGCARREASSVCNAQGVPPAGRYRRDGVAAMA